MYPPQEQDPWEEYLRPAPPPDIYDQNSREFSQPEEPKSFWENFATPANAVRFGGSAIGDALAPVTFGLSPFIGGALGELGGQYLEDQPFDLASAGLEGLLNYMPGAGMLPGKGAGLKAIADYALRSAGHGAVQGAVGSVPRHILRTGEFELPDWNEFAGQTTGGAVIGGATGGLLAGGNVGRHAFLGHSAAAPPPIDFPYDASYLPRVTDVNQAPDLGSLPEYDPNGFLMHTPDVYQGPEIGPLAGRLPDPRQGQLDLGMGFRVENPTQQELPLGTMHDVMDPRQQQLLDLPPNNDPYGMINDIEGMWPPLDPLGMQHQPSFDFSGGMGQSPFTPPRPPSGPSGQGGFNFEPPNMRQLDLFNQPIPGLDQSPYISRPPQPQPTLRVVNEAGEVVGQVDPQTNTVVPIAPEPPPVQVPDENMVPVGDNPNFGIGVNEAPSDDFTRPPTAPPVQGVPSRFDQTGQEQPLGAAATTQGPSTMYIRPGDTSTMRWAEDHGFVRDPEIHPEDGGKVRYVRSAVATEAPITEPPVVNEPLVVTEPPAVDPEGPSLSAFTRNPDGSLTLKSRATILAEETAARLKGPIEGVTFSKITSPDGEGVLEIAVVDTPTDANVKELFRRGFMPHPGKQPIEGKSVMGKGDWSLMPETIAPRKRPQAPLPEDIVVENGQKLSDALRELAKNPSYFDPATGKWTDNANSMIPRDVYRTPLTAKWMRVIEREAASQPRSIAPPPRIPPDAHVPGATLPGRIPIVDGTITIPNERLTPKYRANVEKKFKEVGPSEDGKSTIFKRFFTEDEGTFDPVAMWENLKKKFGRDPTPDEMKDAEIATYLKEEDAIPPEMRDLSEHVPASELRNPTARKWESMIRELDEMNAPDEVYRAIIGPEKDVRLKPGETWRDYVKRGIDFFESKMPRGIKGEEGSVGSGQTVSGTGTSTWDKITEATGWGEGQTRAPKKRGEKRFEPYTETSNAVRDITTSFDASIPGRQGLTQIFTPQFWHAFGNMVKAGRSIEAFDRIDAKIKQLPIMKEHFNAVTAELEPSVAERVGLKQFTVPSRPGPKAEGATSRLLESIPIVGHGFKVSNRMAVTFLNHLSANRAQFLFDQARHMSETAVNTGRGAMPGVMGNIGFKRSYTRQQADALNPYINEVLGKEIADFINTATGHGPLRTHLLPFKQAELNLESSAKTLSNIFFSPGQIASRVRMMNPSTYVMASPFVRKQYLKGIMSTAAAWYAMGQLAQFAGGNDVEVSDDMTSADFGKIRIGDFRLDPAGGFQQYLVAYARAFNGGSTSSATGTFHRFGSGYQAQTQEDMMQRFFVNKLNPITKFGYDLLTASEYNQFHVGDRIAQMFVPLAIQDAIELYYEDPNLLPWMGPVLLGMGTQIYSKGESVGKLIDPENDWLVGGGGARDLIPGMDSSYDLAGLPEPE